MNKPGNTQKEGFQNPFIAGPSVVRNDFIGRKDIIDKIVFFLKDKRDINFLIYGQRRIGKTSLLNKIQYALKFIFAIGSNYKNVELKRLSKLERFGPHAEISYFTREETRALLTSLTVHSIPFKKEAVDLIYHLTSGHPYFTQCLARVSFDSAERKGKKYITPNIVKQELMTATRIFSSSVSRIWDSFHAVDQVILYIIATIKEENRPATTEAIREKAIAFKVVPAVENLSQTLSRLKDIKAIKENKDPEVSYDFYVEFIRKWIGTKSPGQLSSYHGFLGL